MKLIKGKRSVEGGGEGRTEREEFVEHTAHVEVVSSQTVTTPVISMCIKVCMCI
jgi:hypothetical protein